MSKQSVITFSQLPLISGDESLQAGYKQDTKLGFIVKAIYTLAHSLHHMQEELCGDTSKGVCDNMKPFNGKLYRVKIFSSLIIEGFSSSSKSNPCLAPRLILISYHVR